MEIIRRKKANEPKSEWDNFVGACHENPMATLEQVYEVLDQLNTKKLETQYEFHLQPVVDGEAPPNVAPHYFNGRTWKKPIKAERPGPIIQKVLNQLSPPVRSGQDEHYEVYQIRLNDLTSFENLMGTTTLLSVFLNCRDEGGKCYFLPDDSSSQTNWDVLVEMHSKHFPQLGKGKKVFNP